MEFVAHTFIQMTLQLAELALSNTNLQIQHRLGGRTTPLDPSSRSTMRFLDGIRSARLDRASKDRLGGDCQQEWERDQHRGIKM